MPPALSILLPIHNAHPTLAQALTSISRQTHRGFELIAIDDGSTDGSLPLLKTHAYKDKRIKIIELPHGGIVNALNTGLSEARTNFIARMDADDISHPTRLMKQYAFIREDGRRILTGCGVRLFPRKHIRDGMLHYEDWLNSVNSGTEIARDLFIESPFAHPSVMFHRDAAVSLGGYHEKGWPEDYDLWLRMAGAGMGMAKLPDRLLWWRERPERLSRTHGMYSQENFMKVKAHNLLEWGLRGVDNIQIWGAGRDGKKWAKLLMKTGFNVVQFVDIDRKKVGGVAGGGASGGGIPVVWPSDIIRGMPIICAVGKKSAREEIRDYLGMDGYEEPGEFMFVT